MQQKNEVDEQHEVAEEQQLLPPLDGLSLQDHQPKRDWAAFQCRSWEHVMPMPRLQLEDVLPRYRKDLSKTERTGTCSLQCFGEALTAILRLLHGQDVGFNVDLEALLISAGGHGVLRNTGASVAAIRRLLEVSGIPLEASSVPHQLLPGGGAPAPQHYVYARGVSVHTEIGYPLPCTETPWTEELIMEALGSTSTHDQFEEAMEYRERLCKFIDTGPVVVAFNPQTHYYTRRPIGEPYRPKPGDDFVMLKRSDGETKMAAHAVTVYAYECPGGDVRTLRLLYQENAANAPEEKSVGRYVMDPDAVKYYFFPYAHNFEVHLR